MQTRLSRRESILAKPRIGTSLGEQLAIRVRATFRLRAVCLDITAVPAFRLRVRFYLMATTLRESKGLTRHLPILMMKRKMMKTTRLTKWRNRGSQLRKKLMKSLEK